MGLAPGTRVGAYEVLAQIGAGGMGEVYRARDAKLNRDVALKILPEAFALDGDRIARFRREAQVLASLNHPNIAAIYGFEDSGQTHALVLELVEGPTLADRVAKGPIPLEETLAIAKQIAEALEAAHEQGIIHRDLKPANIKLRDDGTVKVLDFGLAKAMEPASAISPALTASPTITTPAMMTRVGMILGTAAYMSPEQAKGRPADKRSDVWAFGCVLYEMLTGKRAFEGEDVADALAAILRADPDWRPLELRAGSSVARIVRQCLKRDRNERLRDIGDANLQLQEAVESAVAAASGVPVAGKNQTTVWRVVAVATSVGFVVSILFLVLHLRGRVADPSPVRFTITTPIDVMVGNLGARLAVSPDGRMLAVVGTAASGSNETRIYVRRLDELTLQPLRGTEGAIGTPFWSPDSEEIAFLTGTQLKRVSVVNGGVQKISDTGGNYFAPFATGSWNAAGEIVFSSGGLTGLWHVPASGGKPTLVAAPQRETGQTRYVYPDFLDDTHFVFTAVYGSLKSELEVGTLDGTRITTLATDATHGVFVPPDRLAFWRNGVVFVQHFDTRRFTIDGQPVALADNVASAGFSRADIRTGFSFSRTDVFAYEPGRATAQSQLTWIDRSGRELGTVGPAGAFSTMQFSPDEQVVATGYNEDENGGTNIWTIDLRTKVPTRLTFGLDRDSNPAWSPDGRRIAFNSTRNGEKSLYDMAAAGGDEKLLVRSTPELGPLSVSDRSKDYLIFNKDLTRDLWVLPLDGTDRKPMLLVRPPSGRADQPNFSPDGHFVAYNSDESGRAEVFVVPFPPTTSENGMFRLVVVCSRAGVAMGEKSFTWL